MRGTSLECSHDPPGLQDEIGDRQQNEVSRSSKAKMHRRVVNAIPSCRQEVSCHAVTGTAELAGTIGTHQVLRHTANGRPRSLIARPRRHTTPSVHCAHTPHTSTPPRHKHLHSILRRATRRIRRLRRATAGLPSLALYSTR